MSFNRGSEWRRWDLHLHTPNTKKEDHFTGASIDEKWDTYYSDIAAYIGDGTNPQTCVAAIGITDYLAIDNYEKVISDGRLPDAVKLVLPNVEMRITPVAAKRPVNIHFIFDPEIATTLEDRFFSRLIFDYQGTQQYSATKNELIRLGRQINAQVKSDEEAYHIGVDQFVVQLDSLKSIFKSDQELREHTIIAISNGNNDGGSGVIRNPGYIDPGSNLPQLTAVRQDIGSFADIILSAAPSDIKYFLGQGSDNPEEVIGKYRSLKPCIIGCDAHENQRIFRPDNDRFCWIKADLTFNGLKQILYEPAERVAIQELKPEEKPGYYVIDRVEIENELFDPAPILFSENLTCIIGGKSTGKSLLMHNIASAIDADQVEKKDPIAPTRVKPLREIRVYWKDGAATASSETDKRKIVYIPQTYLNRLSDEDEERTDVDKIIEDIILQNPDARKASIDRKTAADKYKESIDKQIYELISQNDKAKKLDENLKELGSKPGIEEEIRRLKSKKDEIASKAFLSDTEIEEYDAAVASINAINKRLTDLENDESAISALVCPVELSHEEIDLSDFIRNDYNLQVVAVLEVAQTKWAESKSKLIAKIKTERQRLISMLEKQSAIEASLKSRIADNTAVLELTEKIHIEQKKLGEYEVLEKQRESHTKVVADLIDKVAASCEEHKRINMAYADTINQMASAINSDLLFRVNTPFRCEVFKEAMRSVADIRDLRSIMDLDSFVEGQYSKVGLKDLVEAIMERPGAKTIRLKAGNNAETALRTVASDWYGITYTVVLDDDSIRDMSPGKKALVLLKLLISLAESKCPILIDQPEDDLDNRSIFRELIPFIKEKKVDRQIIIVTHNANIVLGGDAEEIIIANQSGQDAENNAYLFEYRSGSIENNQPECDGNTILPGVLNSKGIQQHICEILEGGEDAFNLRKNKYRFTQ